MRFRVNRESVARREFVEVKYARAVKANLYNFKSSFKYEGFLQTKIFISYTLSKCLRILPNSLKCLHRVIKNRASIFYVHFWGDLKGTDAIYMLLHQLARANRLVLLRSSLLMRYCIK